MAEPVKFKIRGSSSETDAPTADDFLDQVRDIINVLKAVESALDSGGANAIEWRITNATKNSPIGLEATPFAVNHATDVSARAALVRRYAADGFRALQSSADRPAYFSSPVLRRVEKVAKRVLNGLAETDVDFGADAGEIAITPATAAITVTNADALLRPPKVSPYREMGTIEGYYRTLGSDEHGHPILILKNRRTGDDVRCRLTGTAAEEIRTRRVSEVLDHRRLRVRGVIYYKQRGKIDRALVDQIQFMPDASDLPAVEDIIDPDYTDGLTTEEYLEVLRNGIS